MSTCELIAPLWSPKPTHDERTLDEVVAALWQGLRDDCAVACPVCGGEMRPEYAAHARAIGGRCATCGTSLH